MIMLDNDCGIFSAKITNKLNYMKELIKTLEEIKEHQMQTVQLARTTKVYKLAEIAINQALNIPLVSKSFYSDDAIARLKTEYFEKGLKANK